MTKQLDPEIPLCECGYGGEVKHKGDKFIFGHQNRGRHHSQETKDKIGKGNKNPKPKPKPQLCECGCGELSKPGNRFIKGHENRGNPRTQETIQKLRDKKNEWNDEHPDYYKGEGNTNFGKTTPDNVRAKISASLKDNIIVLHHYIYDHANSEKYVMKMTRAAHTRLHWLMRRAGIVVPHINEDVGEWRYEQTKEE